MGLNDAPFDIIGCPHANCTYMSRADRFRRGFWSDIGQYWPILANIGQKTGFLDLVGVWLVALVIRLVSGAD